MDLPDNHHDDPEGFFVSGIARAARLFGIHGNGFSVLMTGHVASYSLPDSVPADIADAWAVLFRQACLVSGITETQPLAGNRPPPSPWLVARHHFLQRIARGSMNIYLHGSSGTGKTFLARHLHDLSGRTGNLVTIHAPGLSPELLESELYGVTAGSYTDAKNDRRGRLQLAEGGTVVFEGMDECSRDTRSRLLPFLKTRTLHPVGSTADIPVDCLIICTGHTDPPRLDQVFYHSISAFPVHIPDILQRPGDISFFLDHFGGCADNLLPLPDLQETISFLSGDEGKGNIAALKNWLVCRTGYNPVSSPGSTAWKSMVDDFKRGVIRDILRRHKGNRTAAAKELGLQRTHLAKLIRDLSPNESYSPGEVHGEE